MPKRFNEDMIRPVLIAYFRVGRLYSKIVKPDKAVQLEHLKQSLNAYKVCHTEFDSMCRNLELMNCMAASSPQFNLV
jgi:hypothetical protein